MRRSTAFIGLLIAIAGLTRVGNVHSAAPVKNTFSPSGSSGRFLNQRQKRKKLRQQPLGKQLRLKSNG